MRALRYPGGDRVEVVDVADPVPDDDQALVRVEVSAICGSERGALSQGHASNSGHEAAGVVESVPRGSAVPVGARVGISAVRGCEVCPACAAGVEVRCDAPRVQLGMHAERVVVAPSTLRPLPSGIDAVDAVLVSGDTLGVPVRGLRRAPHGSGDRVLVVGLGPVGLAHVLVRSFLGAEVIAVEPSSDRRALARELGAVAVESPAELPAGPVDLVIEATGRQSGIDSAFASVRKGGTVLQSGECARATFSPSAVIANELTYVGSWFYATEDFDEILRLRDHGLDPRRLVTHDLPAEAAPDGVAAMLAGTSGKVVLRWS